MIGGSAPAGLPGKPERPAFAPASRFRVGAFECEASRNLIRHGQAVHQLEPLVMDVLCLLAGRQGELVSRDELIEHVWFFNPGADECLTRAISLLRRVFRDAPGGRGYIETVWKRGYLLTAPVGSAAAPDTAGPVSGAAATALASAEFAVAVLPFANHSAAQDDGFLADGLTRDLTMLLSRVPRLRVAAYSSALTVREGREMLPEIARKLGVRYAVSGSLARQGDNVRLRVALMDGVDDAQLWAQRIEAPLDQFFAVQDKIVLDVSTSISSALHLSYAAALKGRRPFQLNAYQLVQRAEALRVRYNRDTAQEIIDLLEDALAADPEDGAVHAALAVQHTQNVTSKFCDAPRAKFALAKKHIERGLVLSPDDPEVLAAAGITATMMGNSRLAVRKLREAVERDPNNPHALAVLGWQHCWLYGDPAGRAMIETAEARAPHHPRYSVWAHYRGHCEIRLGNVARAIEAYREGEARNPGYSLNLVTLAAAHALAGQMDEARSTLESLRGVAPDYALEDYIRLAQRMVYWFGESPTRDEAIGAMRSAWESMPAGQ